jgi:hypothetical protein
MSLLAATPTAYCSVSRVHSAQQYISHRTSEHLVKTQLRFDRERDDDDDLSCSEHGKLDWFYL